MSRRTALDAVVVGAGVVGAAAALAFARDGMSVALVEAREPPPWRALPADSDALDLRVYAFAPDNAALLDHLGVWHGVTAARAQPYRAMRVWDAAGGGELVFDADRFGRRELGWIVEHALLVDRLWAALPGAGVRVHCPESVAGLTQDDDGVSVELDGGTRLRYSKGTVQWSTATDPAAYLRDVTGRIMSSEQLFFTPRAGAPFPDIVCKPGQGLQLRTIFHHNGDGRPDHETLIEAR